MNSPATALIRSSRGAADHVPSGSYAGCRVSRGWPYPRDCGRPLPSYRCLESWPDPRSSKVPWAVLGGCRPPPFPRLSCCIGASALPRQAQSRLSANRRSEAAVRGHTSLRAGKWTSLPGATTPSTASANSLSLPTLSRETRNCRAEPPTVTRFASCSLTQSCTSTSRGTVPRMHTSATFSDHGFTST